MSASRSAGATLSFHSVVSPQILLLVRNFVPAHEQIMAGGWNVAEVAR